MKIIHVYSPRRFTQDDRDDDELKVTKKFIPLSELFSVMNEIAINNKWLTIEIFSSTVVQQLHHAGKGDARARWLRHDANSRKKEKKTSREKEKVNIEQNKRGRRTRCRNIKMK